MSEASLTMAAVVQESWALGAAAFLLSVAAGGLVGRSMARRAIGPAERGYIRRTCLLLWTLIGLFLAAAFSLPSPFRFVIPALLFFAIPALLYRWSVRRQLLRAREEHNFRLKR